MIELKLHRTMRWINATKGELQVIKDGHVAAIFPTVELPWENNQKQISCIPEGKYFCKIHTSAKFGWTLWLQDVPNRTAILIHAANYVRQLRGCIAPGMEHKDIDGDGIIDVARSKEAMSNLQKHIKEDVWITIYDPHYDLDPKTEKRV